MSLCNLLIDALGKLGECHSSLLILFCWEQHTLTWGWTSTATDFPAIDSSLWWKPYSCEMCQCPLQQYFRRATDDRFRRARVVELIEWIMSVASFDPFSSFVNLPTVAPASLSSPCPLTAEVHTPVLFTHLDYDILFSALPFPIPQPQWHSPSPGYIGAHYAGFVVVDGV